MEALINERFLNKRQTFARYASYIGLGALVIGLLSSTRIPFLSYALLLVGLGAASVGSFLASRYVREPRADQLLSRALDGLDKRYTLLSYYLPTDHVVFSHKGFTVIETRPQAGEVTYRSGRWVHRGGRKIMQLFGEPSLGRPDRELQQQIDYVNRWLRKAGLEGKASVGGVIAFTSQDVALSVEGAPYPAVRLGDLAQYLRDLDVEAPLSTSQRREIEGRLDALVSQA